MQHLLALTLLVITVNVVAFSIEKRQYQVGTFVEKTMVSDGSLVSASRNYAKKVEQGHYSYHVSGDTGEFYIDAPTSVGMSILSSWATQGQSADIHKDSFLDTLHQGDKVLFAAKCNKHNRCEFEMPNPDHPNKLVRTVGSFEPAQGKSNVSSLCGTGKLTANIEQQYCGAAAVSAAQSPVVQPVTMPIGRPAAVETQQIVSPVAQPAPEPAQQPAPAVVKVSSAPASSRTCISSMTDAQGNETCLHYADEQK